MTRIRRQSGDSHSRAAEADRGRKSAVDISPILAQDPPVDPLSDASDRTRSHDAQAGYASQARAAA